MIVKLYISINKNNANNYNQNELARINIVYLMIYD